MALSSPTLPEALLPLRRFLAFNFPGLKPREIGIYFDVDCEEGLRLPFVGEPLPEEKPEPFVPTPYQAAILKALDGKALRTDAIANKVGDRRRLFRRRGGLPELRANGLVAHHRRCGYYRPDAMPVGLFADQPAQVQSSQA